MKREKWGEVDGKTVERLTLANDNGMLARIITFGATLVELHVPDREGRFTDVVLGFDELQPYLETPHYFGAVVGRVANRIFKGRFSIDGDECAVTQNAGQNHLHGGEKGFDKAVWSIATTRDDAGQSLTLTYTSPDGEEGYPGSVQVWVTYTLGDDNELMLDMRATANRKTPVNLAHHVYWNLDGNDTVLNHELGLNAGHYTVLHDDGIPTGEIAAVAGTALDFTNPHKVGRDIGQYPEVANDNNPGGYDHNFVIDGNSGELRPVASLYEPDSGRLMDIESTQPGMQLYSSNYLDGSVVGKNTRHKKHAALCLETQHFPDSVNHPNFPNCLIGPDRDYHEVIVYRFATRG